MAARPPAATAMPRTTIRAAFIRFTFHNDSTAHTWPSWRISSAKRQFMVNQAYLNCGDRRFPAPARDLGSRQGAHAVDPELVRAAAGNLLEPSRDSPCIELRPQAAGGRHHAGRGAMSADRHV